MSRCNVCGGTTWGDKGQRPNIRCLSCGSLERTRVTKLFLDELWNSGNASRVLHLAPEKALYEYFRSMPLAEYRATDLQPDNFRFGSIEKMDLCTDSAFLPSDTYDLIIHAHVMEHIPCNVTAVLAHIHRSLTPDGTHLLCIPISSGYSAEDLSPLSGEEAKRRFGQSDHVRRFGREDLDKTVGMLFDIPTHYRLTDYFSPYLLQSVNIPDHMWRGYTGTSVIPLRKTDYLLDSTI